MVTVPPSASLAIEPAMSAQLVSLPLKAGLVSSVLAEDGLDEPPEEPLEEPPEEPPEVPDFLVNTAVAMSLAAASALTANAFTVAEAVSVKPPEYFAESAVGVEPSVV